MGDPVRRFVAEVFDSDEVLSQLRAVQGIVTHLETFPVERAQAACERAHRFGCLTVKGIKTLRKALDLEPLPPEPSDACTTVSAGRFARSASSRALAVKAGRHELH